MVPRMVVVQLADGGGNGSQVVPAHLPPRARLPGREVQHLGPRERPPAVGRGGEVRFELCKGGSRSGILFWIL